MSRFLIVNADDFGLSPGVNRGVARAHEQGIVTSASLMTRAAAAAEAAAYARARPRLSVGLHVDLGEWVYRNERWEAVRTFVDTEDARAVRVEVERQLAAFRRLAGGNPTHLDSHQHAHRSEPAASVLSAVAEELGIPLRHGTIGFAFVGGFYGQTREGASLPAGVSVDGLIALLRALPPGVTELGCHPGLGGDSGSVYRTEREREVETLCDPRIRWVLADEGIELCSFHDVAALGPAGTLPQAGVRRG